MTRIFASPILALNPQSSAGNQALQLDACVSNFSRQASDFHTIGSFALAGLVGQFSSQAFLSAGLVRNPLLRHFLSQTVSISSEAAALTSFQAPSLLEQGAPLSQIFRAHVLNLTALRTSAALFRHNIGLFQHFSASFGMMAGHHLATALHWEEKTSRSLFEEFFEAEFVNLQMETGHLLGRGFGAHSFGVLQQHSARQADLIRATPSTSRGVLSMAHDSIASPKRIKYHPNFVADWEAIPTHIQTRVLRAIEAIADSKFRNGANLKKMGGIELRQIRLSYHCRLLFVPRGKNFEIIHVGSHNETDRVIRQWYLAPMLESKGSHDFNPFRIRESSSAGKTSEASDDVSRSSTDGEAAYDRFWRKYEASQASLNEHANDLELSIEEACPALKDPNDVLSAQLDEAHLKEFPELATCPNAQIVALSEKSLWRGDPDSRLFLHLQALRTRLGSATEVRTLEALAEMDELLALAESKDDPSDTGQLLLDAYRKVHPLDRLRLQAETPQFEALHSSALRAQALEFILGREMGTGDMDALLERSSAADPLSEIATWMIHSPRGYMRIKRRPKLERAHFFTFLIRDFPLCEYTSDAPLRFEELLGWMHPQAEALRPKDRENFDIAGYVEHCREEYSEMDASLSRFFPRGEFSEQRSEPDTPEAGSTADMLHFWNAAPANFRRIIRLYRDLLGERANQSKLSQAIRHLAVLKKLGASTEILEEHAFHLFEYAKFIDDKKLKEGFEHFPGVMAWLEKCSEVMEEPMATSVAGEENPDIQRFYTRNNRIAGAAFSRLLRHDEMGFRISESVWKRVPEEELSDEQMDAWLPELHRFIARTYLKNREFVRGRLPLDVEGNPLLDIDMAERTLTEVPYDFPEAFVFNPSDTFDKWMMNQHLLGVVDPRQAWVMMETMYPNGSYTARTLSPEIANIYRQQQPNIPFDVQGETCTIGVKTSYRPYSPTYRWGLAFENLLSPEIFRLVCFCKRFEHPFRARFVQLMNRSANAMLAGVPTFWATICFYRKLMIEYCEAREGMLQEIEARLPDFPAMVFQNLPERDLLGMELQTRVMMDFKLAQGADIKRAMAALQHAYMELAQQSTGNDVADAPLRKKIAAQFGRLILRHRRRLMDTLEIPPGLQKTFNSLLDRINTSRVPELCRDSASFQQTFATLHLPEGVDRLGNFAHYYARAIVLMGLVRDRHPALDAYMRDVLSPLSRENGPATVLATLEFYLAHRQEILDLVPPNLQ